MNEFYRWIRRAVLGSKPSTRPRRRTAAQSSDIRIGRFAPVVALAAAIAGSGCSHTLTKDECRKGAWADIGYADGAAGFDAERIEDHREACRRVDVSPDEAAYNRGREKGLLQYCTRSNGLRIGRSGGRYGGVCPERLEDAFLKAFHYGRAIREVERDIASARGNIAAAEQAIKEAHAWTPEVERSRRLAEVDRDISRKRGRISQQIEATANQIDELLRTKANNKQIEPLWTKLNELQADDTRLDLERVRRHAAVKEDHERSRERLIERNRSRLADSIERKSRSQERKAALEARLSDLLKAVKDDAY